MSKDLFHEMRQREIDVDDSGQLFQEEQMSNIDKALICFQSFALSWKSLGYEI